MNAAYYAFYRVFLWLLTSHIQPELFFDGLSDNRLIAAAMFGYNGYHDWLYCFVVLPEHQNKSYGIALLTNGEAMGSFFAKSCMGFILKPWIMFKSLIRF